MAAARYWRIVGVETYGGGDLELSELHLYGSSGRIGMSATVTSSHAPITGTLGALGDADLLTTCRFAGAAVLSAGFAIVWDMGAGVTADVIGLRVGSALTQDAFLSGLTLQYFDGSVWVTSSAFGRFPWVGASVLGTVPLAGGINLPTATLFLDGNVDFSDTSPIGRAMTPNAGATISAVQALYGTKSMLFNGTSGRVVSPASSSLAFSSSEDFTISFNSFKSSDGSMGYDSVVSTTTNGSATDGWFVELSATRGLVFAASGAIVFSISLNPNTSAWKNWEVSRKGGVLRAFGGGVKLYEAADTRGYVQAGLTVGSAFPGSYAFNGFLQQVLILKGQALHDSDFVPGSLIAGGGQQFLPSPVNTALGRGIIAASAPVAAHGTQLLAVRMARDVEFGGAGTIYGTTKTKGTPNAPTMARVVLQHQRSKLPVRETWSDPVTGAFEFNGIDTSQQYLTLAEDAAGNFRPVAANKLIPKVL